MLRGDEPHGLLRGLGKMFATPIEVTLIESKDEGADHDVFQLRFPG